MRFKFLSLFAAILLLSACETPSEEGSDSTSTGSTSSTSTSTATQAPATTIPGPAAGSQEDLTVQVGDRVFFDFDKSDLTSESQNTLQRLAVWLNGNPSTTLTIEGHCDERGTREYNLALGERRANSVRDFLVALGINPNRVGTISFGKERPAVLGSNDSAWAQNRRGAFVVN